MPTLIDDDFVIWDSHTICAYLIDKYGKNDELYPKDLQQRAKCNQRLFFDASSLFVRLRDCTLHVLYKGGSEIDHEKSDPIYAAYDILEAFLITDRFLVGNDLTIADICVGVTIRPLEMYAPIQAEKYPNIFKWLKNINEIIPFFDEFNEAGIIEYRQLIHNNLEKNKQKQ